MRKNMQITVGDLKSLRVCTVTLFSHKVLYIVDVNANGDITIDTEMLDETRIRDIEKELQENRHDMTDLTIRVRMKGTL